jgi:hypothetical protein
MPSSNAADVATRLLSLIGVVLGLLWAAFVVYGLFTGTGPVGDMMVRVIGYRSMKLHYLVASAGVLIYLLLDTPRRRLRARDAAGARPGRGGASPGQPAGPRIAPLADTFRRAPEPQAPRPPPGQVPGQAPKQVPAEALAAPPRPRRGSGRGLIALVMLGVAAAIGGYLWWELGRSAEQPAGQAGTSAPGAGQAEPPDSEPGGALFAAVLEARNDFGLVAGTVAKSYAREFGTGPAPQQGLSPSVYPFNSSSKQSLEKLAAALAAGPGQEPLRRLASDYLAAGQALLGPIEEAEKYYGRGGQQEDRWARGKALHTRLLGAFRGYFTAAEALAPEASRIGAERRARRRARLVQEGAVRRVAGIDTVAQGRAVVDLLERRQEQGDVKPAALKEALDRYEKTVDGLGTLVKDPAGTQREFGAYAVNFSAFTQHAEYFLRTAREVEREGRGGRNAANESGEERGERLLRDFNELVRAANELAR